jgi:hypothetical protein
MANPAPDPPPSISAAELRRRLLASTPPPMAAVATQPALDLDAAAAAVGVSSYGQNPGSLAKLRMPGQPAGEGVAQSPAPAVPPAPPRRMPVVGVRGVDPSALGLPPAPSGPQSIPVARIPVEGVAPPPRPPGGSGVIGLPAKPGSGAVAKPAARTPDPADFDRIRGENKELRKLLGEMKQLLQEASDNEQQAAAREAELQAALADKQRLTDEMAAQLQAIEEQINTGALAPQAPAGPPKSRTELEEWADELEKEQAKLAQERKRFEEDRQQLREDEEALEKQMRQMEVGMARERAVMARQEQELKRIQAEIEQNLDLMQRGDPNLRDQMQKFQRRAADVMGGPSRR